MSILRCTAPLTAYVKDFIAAHSHVRRMAPVDPPLSPRALMSAVSEDRYARDLRMLARPRYTQAERAVIRQLCAERLEGLGYRIEMQRYPDDGVHGAGVNIVATLAGSGALAHEQVLLTAHYDGVPGSAAVDDNASGVAAVLEAARVLANRPRPRTLTIVLWDQEEVNAHGSRVYAAQARVRGDTITTCWVLDAIGHRSAAPGSQALPPGLALAMPQVAAQLARNDYRADFISTIEARGGTAADFADFASELGLPVLRLVPPWWVLDRAPDLRRSDHASFWDVGYPAVLISDTAEFRNAHYHTVLDQLGDVDVRFACQVVRATVGAVAKALG